MSHGAETNIGNFRRDGGGVVMECGEEADEL